MKSKKHEANEKCKQNFGWTNVMEDVTWETFDGMLIFNESYIIFEDVNWIQLASLLGLYEHGDELLDSVKQKIS